LKWKFSEILWDIYKLFCEPYKWKPLGRPLVWENIDISLRTMKLLNFILLNVWYTKDGLYLGCIIREYRQY